MPTYEYACRSCGSHLEVVQAFTDDPLTECPSCDGSLKKVFGSIGIAFKGSGFYKTDSRSSATASKGAGSSDGASGNGSSDSKPKESTAASKDSSSSSKEPSSKPKESSGSGSTAKSA